MTLIVGVLSGVELILLLLAALVILGGGAVLLLFLGAQRLRKHDDELDARMTELEGKLADLKTLIRGEQPDDGRD